MLIHYMHNDYIWTLILFVRITNLKYWGTSDLIVTKTLQILNDLSVGYSSVRKLVKLDEVQFILNNHTVSLQSNSVYYLIKFYI